MDIPDTIPPNGPAYTRTETRTGPPLSYVAEKLRGCLKSLHSLHSLTVRDVPDGLPCPERFQDKHPNYDPKLYSVLEPCYAAFRYALTSYLALNNLLAFANDQDIFERLLLMPNEDFDRWLDDIDREGSVT